MCFFAIVVRLLFSPEVLFWWAPNLLFPFSGCWVSLFVLSFFLVGLFGPLSCYWRQSYKIEHELFLNPVVWMWAAGLLRLQTKDPGGSLPAPHVLSSISLASGERRLQPPFQFLLGFCGAMETHSHGSMSTLSLGIQAPLLTKIFPGPVLILSLHRTHTIF